MNFSLTEEESMLESLAQRLFAQEGSAAAGQAGKGLWSRMGEVGLLGLLVSEACGGSARSAHDGAVAAHIVAKAMGRSLADAPFAASAVVAASLLEACAGPALQQELLPRMATGGLTLALAHDEGAGDTDFVHTGTVAVPAAQGYLLRGRKREVPQGAGVDGFIVSARTSGAGRDEAGISLFVVGRQTAGLQVDAGADGRCSLILNDVSVATDRLVGSVGEGLAPMRHAIHRGIAALLADAVGAMQGLLEMSITHLRTRRQFGQPLASFQALQHHIADMATSVEQATAMSLMAAMGSAIDEEIPRAARISAAKAYVCRQGLQVARVAIQLHGGMGMTQELATSRYFHRLMAIDSAWGKGAAHAAAFARSLAPFADATLPDLR
jgi:alkylation response protein AidB-like acyl-CoA dehydrogenase